MTASTTTERGGQGGQRGVSRVLAKLDNSIEAGNYYEAHQMYRTLYFRYIAQRKFDDCLQLLYNGALKLASKQQQTSAADLGLLLLDTLEKRGHTTTNDLDLWLERLAAVIGSLRATTVERETLINRSIKWSGEMVGNNFGHPIMHKKVAQIYWAENNIELARHHYLLCLDGPLCGRILVAVSTKHGYPSEVDLFIVQAVLQQLCVNLIKPAEATFVSYTTHHPQIKQNCGPYKLPLLNFIYYLFRVIESGRLNVFRTLCALYKPSLRRDASFEKYLAKIGVIYFGAPPPRLMGGMFGDLFTRLFQELEDGEEQHPHVAGRTGANTRATELD